MHGLERAKYVYEKATECSVALIEELCCLNDDLDGRVLGTLMLHPLIATEIIEKKDVTEPDAQELLDVIKEHIKNAVGQKIYNCAAKKGIKGISPALFKYLDKRLDENDPEVVSDVVIAVLDVLAMVVSGSEGTILEVYEHHTRPLRDSAVPQKIIDLIDSYFIGDKKTFN